MISQARLSWASRARAAGRAAQTSGGRARIRRARSVDALGGLQQRARIERAHCAPPARDAQGAGSGRRPAPLRRRSRRAGLSRCAGASRAARADPARARSQREGGVARGAGTDGRDAVASRSIAHLAASPASVSAPSVRRQHQRAVGAEGHGQHQPAKMRGQPDQTQPNASIPCARSNRRELAPREIGGTFRACVRTPLGAGAG